MSTSLTFDDILLVPAPLSTIKSRSDVDTSTVLCGKSYKMGIISSNMDTVYSPALARETARLGGISVVHRFCSIEENIRLFKEGIYNDIKPWCSVGIGPRELERAISLVEAGAEVLVLDVANGANIAVIEHSRRLRERFGDSIKLVVGNFATKEQIEAFSKEVKVDLYKLSVGSGSACSTSVVTGVGVRSFSCLEDCLKAGYPVIFDGGIKTSGDYAKALALGASGIMVGRLFAGTEEGPGKTIINLTLKNDYSSIESEDKFIINEPIKQVYKQYRGSASLESYKVQGKVSSFRAPEGESFLVPLSGSVEDLMNNFDGGLRSSMSYLNAKNLTEFRNNAKFVQVTANGVNESKPHGKQ